MSGRMNRRVLRSTTFAVFLILTLASALAIAQPPGNSAVNQAMELNGLQQWMQIHDDASTALRVFTAECWIKVQGSGLIVTRDLDSGAPSDWQLWYDHSGRHLAFITAKMPPDEYFYTPQNSITPDRWTHVAIVVNGPAGYAFVFIDGLLSTSARFTSRQFNFMYGLAWGGYYNNAKGAYLVGQIDEARYWNVERTQEQIQNAKDHTLPLSDRSGLVGYWMFCGNFADSSGYGHHGETRGSPHIVDVFDLPAGIACPPDAGMVSVLGPSHDTLRCQPYRDTTFTVLNTGSGRVTLLRSSITGANASDFQLVNPVTIPPEQSIEPNERLDLLVRFRPTGFGFRTATLELETDAPNAPMLSATLTGTNEDMRIAVSDTVLDFGILCPNETNAARVTVTNLGATSQILRFAVDTPYSLPVNTITIASQENRTIDVIFDGSPGEGRFTNILTIEDDCGIIHTVLCTAEVETPRVTGDTLRFRTQLGESETAVGYLRNRSSRAVTISSLSIAHPDFVLMAPVLPQDIPPGAELAVTVSYTARDTGIVLAPVTAVVFPCSVNAELPIAATGYVSEAIVSFPMLEASIDTTLAIPLTLRSAGSLEGMGTASYSLRVRFNKSVLFPLGVRTNRPGTGAVLLGNTRDESDRILDIAVTDDQSPIDGVLLYLDCRTALGNTDRTPLHIEDFTWVSPGFRTATIDGEVRFHGHCDAGGRRMIRIPAQVTLHQNYPNPCTAATGTSISWDIGVPEEEAPVSLWISDLLGHEKQVVFDGYASRGTVSVPVDTRSLREGVYLYQLRYGSQTRTRIMTVIK